MEPRLLPGEDFVGRLKRKQGSRSKSFTYATKGSYLFEYADERHHAERKPRRVLDLASCDSIELKDPSSSVIRVTTRNHKELMYQAENVADRDKWMEVMQRSTVSVKRAGSCPAALIAPVRRRHVSVSSRKMERLRRESLESTTSADSSDMMEEAPADYGYRVIGSLRVSIMEGEKIGDPKRKLYSPYCVVVVDNKPQVSTSTKWLTKTPFWAEEFFFDNVEASCKFLHILVHHQSKEDPLKDPRIGQLTLDMRELSYGPLDQWFNLSSPDAVRPSSGESVGSLRIKAIFTIEKILPFFEYKDLLELVVDAELTCAKALAVVANTQLDEVAGTLVNIFVMTNRVTDFVRTLTTVEIHKTDLGAILFRGNTLGTKVIDMYMKMVGLDYLQQTLTGLIRGVAADKDGCEVDPSRLERGEDIKKNQKKVLQWAKQFFETISASLDNCPDEVKLVFANIRSEIVTKFGEDGPEKYTSISGFIFLRFFCPAILNPALFGMLPEQPSGKVARSLTLVAKTLQNLANLVPSGKEVFMDFENSFMEENMEKMKEVITRFATPTNPNVDSSEAVDKRDFSREMSALHRHFNEKLDALRKLAKEEPDEKLNPLFVVLARLDQRLIDYEKQALLQAHEKKKVPHTIAEEE